MRNLILVKYDLSDKVVQSLQSICSVYVDTPRIILLETVLFIIQPDINRLLAYCKGGNFNIHIKAWFSYFIS